MERVPVGLNRSPAGHATAAHLNLIGLEGRMVWVCVRTRARVCVCGCMCVWMGGGDSEAHALTRFPREGEIERERERCREVEGERVTCARRPDTHTPRGQGF